ncbi:nitroreductase family protein [Flavobacteriaceae bacterium]|nr:nitroreductase family protein [Flavobacteriaceae bacterium]
MKLTEVIHKRRAMRVYKENAPINTETVKQCIEKATLAPSSSNLQLWEFYHVTNPEKLNELRTYCFNQVTAKTAQQMVVVVTRKDLWKRRCRSNASFLEELYDKNPKDYTKREKFTLNYFRKLLPITYGDFFRIFGYLKYTFFSLLGLFRPVYRELTHNDIRVVAHKSTALAAQTFMLAMVEAGYDTCPMEGIDSRRVKGLLHLPYGAEINMVISCGIGTENGSLRPRFRVPFEEVYKEV